MRLYGAPLRFVLAPLAAEGAEFQSAAGKAPDSRGDCVEHVDPRTTFALSMDVNGPLWTDFVGSCDYGVEVSVGEQGVATLRGPLDENKMAPASLEHPFPISELEQEGKVKLWDRDVLEDDWGNCTVRETWEEFVEHMLRARAGREPAVEAVAGSGSGSSRSSRCSSTDRE